MKKNIIGIIIILIVGLGFYFWKKSPILAPNTMFVNETTGEITGVFSLQDAIGLNRPLQCALRLASDPITAVGSLYVYNSEVRADFDIEGTPAGAITSHFIVKDDTSYSWTSLGQVGFKKPTIKSAGVDAEAQDQATIVGIEDQAAYTCKSWIADPNLFALPTGITFSQVE